MTKIFSLVLAAFAVGCSTSGSDLGFPGEDDPGNPGAPGANGDTTAANAPPAPLCADVGKTYVAMDGQPTLTNGRAHLAVGVDRGRMKPYSALKTEYPRVLGNTPGLLDSMGPTFGQSPDRWYDEPEPNAVSIYSAYRVAFQGCLELVKNDAKYGTAPDTTTASAECTTWARKFWSRTATPDEVTTCATFATTGTTKETDARRRWAYTCATVLTSANFLGN